MPPASAAALSAPPGRVAAARMPARTSGAAMRRMRVFMPWIRRRAGRRHTASMRARAAAIASRTPPGPRRRPGGGGGRLERAVPHRARDLLVRLAERHSRADELLGGVGREQERIGGGRGQPLAVELEAAHEHRERREGAAQVGARGEDGRLVLLQVAVVGERKALHRREQSGQAADRGARLAAHELGDVGVQLLRHHRRARRGVLRQAREAELGRRPEHELLADPREVGEARPRPRRGSRARSRGRRRRRGSSAAAARAAAAAASSRRARPRRAGSSEAASAAAAKRAQVALEHLHPGEQVVPDRDRLGALEVRVARASASRRPPRRDRARHAQARRARPAPRRRRRRRRAGTRPRPGRCGSGPRGSSARRRRAAARSRSGRPRPRERLLWAAGDLGETPLCLRELGVVEQAGGVEPPRVYGRRFAVVGEQLRVVGAEERSDRRVERRGRPARPRGVMPWSSPARGRPRAPPPARRS